VSSQVADSSLVVSHMAPLSARESPRGVSDAGANPYSRSDLIRAPATKPAAPYGPTDNGAWMMIHTDALVAEHFERLAEGRSSTAYHEAGHICANAWLGLELGEVSIRPTFRTLGHAASLNVLTHDDLNVAHERALEGRPIPGHIRDLIEAIVIVLLVGGYTGMRAVIEWLATEVPALPVATTDQEAEAAEMRGVLLKIALDREPATLRSPTSSRTTNRRATS
jgi:hypothetical protein